MKLTPKEIPEVILIEPDVFRDARGFFLETWHERKYAEGGITGPFVQDNHSHSRRGSLRGLPAVSFYASYEPLGGYFGVRSGFLSLKELQYVSPGGDSYPGEASSFLAAGLAGYFFEVLGINFFVESGYSLRIFPSVVWTGENIPADIPRKLNLSGWFLSAGIQFTVTG